MPLPKILLAGLLCLPFLLCGHPIPDIPVNGEFTRNGSVEITIDVDPRSFGEDPEQELYLLKVYLDMTKEEEKQQMFREAQKLIEKSLKLRFEPDEWFIPQFEFEFANRNGGDLTELDDEVTIRGVWRTHLNATHTLYKIRAEETAEFAVLFKNSIEGEPQPDVHVLFPGEESVQLDITRVRPPGPWITLKSFFRQGFVHVLPMGLDHILFVLGIFLLSRKWKPLLLQVTMFTLAHTITLGLATLDIVNIPIKPVEIVIAASICIVALQNIFRPIYTKDRLVIIFVLGLIHGLGFASALSELDLNPTALATGLLGFNIGVEFGQLAVLAMAWLVTLPFVNKDEYRRVIVIPASICITLVGAYWVIERLG